MRWPTMPSMPWRGTWSRSPTTDWNGDRPWLAYASHCVATRSTGADRMLRLWRSGGDSAARLGLLARWRALDIPS